MTARLPLLLALAVLLAACVHRSPEPGLAVFGPRPEIVIRAPIERVRLSIVTQQKSEGALLAGQSDDRLVFVTQVSYPAINVATAVQFSGAPYVRTTYVLAGGAHDTRVSVSNELVSNYGTAYERARPVDTQALRQAQQRSLLRVRAVVEKSADR